MNNTDALRDILSGRQSICLSLYVAGGIVIATIICTCCCTLIVRHKCARLIDKITGRRKKEKHFSRDIEEGRTKLRKKKKRLPPPDLPQTAVTDVTAPIITPRELERLEERESPTPCYKCYRKKKKGRRAKRQTR